MVLFSQLKKDRPRNSRAPSLKILLFAMKMNPQQQWDGRARVRSGLDWRWVDCASSGNGCLCAHALCLAPSDSARSLHSARSIRLLADLSADLPRSQIDSSLASAFHLHSNRRRRSLAATCRLTNTSRPQRRRQHRRRQHGPQPPPPPPLPPPRAFSSRATSRPWRRRWSGARRRDTRAE